MFGQSSNEKSEMAEACGKTVGQLCALGKGNGRRDDQHATSGHFHLFLRLEDRGQNMSTDLRLKL